LKFGQNGVERKNQTLEVLAKSDFERKNHKIKWLGDFG